MLGKRAAREILIKLRDPGDLILAARWIVRRQVGGIGRQWIQWWELLVILREEAEESVYGETIAYYSTLVRRGNETNKERKYLLNVQM